MPAEVTENGQVMNQIDRRFAANLEKPQYKMLDEEGPAYLNGERTYDALRRIGHAVEERLAGLISERNGEPIDPRHLPEMVDAGVRKQIEQIELLRNIPTH